MRCPERGDRVAILGAGPAGIHMATRLRSAGFRDVTLYEARDRIGGKCHTLDFDGLPIDFGAAVIPSRTATLRFMRRWGVPLIETDLTFYDASAQRRVGAAAKRLAALALKWVELGRLTRLIERLLTPDLLLDPQDPRWRTLALPFAMLLRRERLPLVLGYMRHSLYPYGYGTPDMVSAWYGLEAARGWLAALVDQRWFMVADGYQRGLESIARKAGLRVELNRPARSLTPQAGSVRCRFADDSEQLFDFVVNTAPHHIAGPLTASIFGQVRQADYHVGLIDTARRGATHVVGRIAEFQPHQVNSVFYHHRARGCASRRPGRELLSYYCAPNFTVADHHLEPADQAERVRDSLERFHGIDRFELRHRETWSYFPQFDPRAIEAGVLADIFSSQGEQGIWHVGAACCFESVPNVIDYNDRLLAHFGLA